MKLRTVEYKLSTTAAELKAKAHKKGMYAAQYKSELEAKLPASKLQVWTVFNDDRRSEWRDVPAEAMPLTVAELENL